MATVDEHREQLRASIELQAPGRAPVAGATGSEGGSLLGGGRGAEGGESSRRAGRGAEDERRQVTVLFADLSDFTSLSERFDPEVARAIQKDLFPEVARTVLAYDGFVEKFVGDAILAVFGAPVAHEDDPERALRAALAMRERMGALNARWEARVGRRLELHIAINTGTVIAGGISGAGADDPTYAVTGDTTNTAARLLGAAQAGRILVGPHTYRRTKHAFLFQAREPLRLKGKAGQLQTYELVGPRPAPERRADLAERGIRSPLIGRDAELAALVSRLGRLAAGEGGLVAVVGEAGVGKTRLLAEARERSGAVENGTPKDSPDPHPVTWLVGRTLSYGRSISYWPFLEILRQDAGIAEGDAAQGSLAKLRARVQALFPLDGAEVLPFLATLLSLPLPAELAAEVQYLDADVVRRQIFRVVRRYVQRLTREGSLVLVFEDLHWVDQSSAALLEYLLPLVREHPLLICGVSRPDNLAPAAQMREVALREFADRYVEVTLRPLSPEASATLLRNLLDVDALPAHVKQAILSKTEGNPLFLEEVIRALIDVGSAVRDERTGVWRATRQAEQIAIPDTVQGVIMARIDRLPREVRHTLRLAAVIGRAFPYRVLRAIAEPEHDLDGSLAHLRRLELIDERAGGSEVVYLFRHVLVQEATYETILVLRRQELHGAVAAAMEALYAGRLEKVYGVLAYHYARAQAWGKAQEYMLKAGDQSHGMAADAEALTFYEEAMATYERAHGDAWDPLQRAVLERKIGEGRFWRGEHVRATASLLRALTSLGHPYPAPTGNVRPALLRQAWRQLLHLWFPGRHVRLEENTASAVDQERSHIYHVLSWIDYYDDQQRLLLDVLLLLNAAEGSGDLLGAVRGLSGTGLICDLLPAFGLAERYHRRAVELAERLQHPQALGQARMLLAYHHDHQAQWEEALEQYRRAAEIVLQTGDSRRWGPCATRIAWLTYVRGDVEEGVRLSEEMIRRGADEGDLVLQTWGEAIKGRCLLREGRLVEAEAMLRRCREVFLAVPDTTYYTTSTSFLGQCHLRQGRLEEALEMLEEGDRARRAYRLRGMARALSTNLLAEGYLTAAEGVAGQQRKAYLAQAERALGEAKRYAGGARDSVPTLYRLRGSYEWLRGRPAPAFKWWRRSLADAEALGAPYDQALARLELGRHAGDSGELEAAEALFRRLGAALELQRTTAARAAVAPRL